MIIVGLIIATFVCGILTDFTLTKMSSGEALIILPLITIALMTLGMEHDKTTIKDTLIEWLVITITILVMSTIGYHLYHYVKELISW